MSVHLQREVDKLKKSVLSLCALVEDNVQLAVRALIDRDDALAKEAQRRDLEIDEREVDVEEECLKILALHQPVAIDLRFVVSSMKIDNDLERIGDLAVNLANKAIFLANRPAIEMPFNLPDMGEKTKAMLRDALDSFVNMDSQLAYRVLKADDEVDQIKRETRIRIEELIRETPSKVSEYYAIMGVARNLERIADHATNIAEDVIYMTEGKIIRHSDGDE